MSENDLWFTRVTLRRDAPDIAPLIGRLLPDGSGDGEKLNAVHQLLWTLMPEAMQKAGKPARAEGGDKAAFLWREAEKSKSWYMLGPAPRSDSSFFHVETKAYALAAAAGDRFSFDLIANATVNRLVDPDKGRAGRTRCDVVMDALKAEEKEPGAPLDRAARRQTVAKEALGAWLAEQGARNGFSVEAFDLASYRTVEIDRSRAGSRSSFARKGPFIGVGHMRGLLKVQDPTAFAAKVATGLGRAKAFGCGLILLRRMD
jgi:CRISPR system Cascade subunit CasE